MNASIEFGLHEHRDLNRYGWTDNMLDMDRASYVNCREDYCDSERGEFWIQVDRLAMSGEGTFLVIVGGSFGNYNSPGADHCTTAYLYDVKDPEAVAAYNADVARLSGMEEYAETEPSTCE